MLTCGHHPFDPVMNRQGNIQDDKHDLDFILDPLGKLVIISHYVHVDKG